MVRKVNLLSVLADVARALVRLHTVGIVHRDVKCRNVLITPRSSKDCRAILIDFGLACNMNDDEPSWLTRTVGTKKYRPPEMEGGRTSAHPSEDIYSFGTMVKKLLGQMRSSDWDSDANRFVAHRPE